MKKRNGLIVFGVTMESKGEETIRKILQRAGVPFKQEYSFSSLKSPKGKPLRFDFAVYPNTKKLFLIEFQGEQHYKYVKHFSKNLQKWHYARAMDYKKCRFSLIKHIPLYCIPYTDLEKLHTFADLKNEKYLIKNENDMYLSKNI